VLRILDTYDVPTGKILVVQGNYGKLEMLSIGDYGKDVNVKADFLGIEREPARVRHMEMLPLTEKWVITISTQYGCSMGCRFCDVPKVGPGRNCTSYDMIEQVITGLSLYPDVTESNRLNIHFARMGEPTWNPNVIEATHALASRLVNYRIHPVVSTMMPRSNKFLRKFLMDWMDVKNNRLNGEAGLQLSINSTDEAERHDMFGGSALPLKDIGLIAKDLVPRGRKIALNFALAGYTIDPDVLLKYFDPDRFMVKLTPMHKTRTCVSEGIKTEGDYTEYAPYKETEYALKSAGYDTLVFIASREEDEGRITCGNALLSGTRPFDLSGDR
jgi:23S rRNA (adenine2503-C2)-methyltransferase